MKKTISLALGVIVALSALFVSCAGNDSYPCSVQISSTEGGKASITNHEGVSIEVLAGVAVEVVAVSDAGYEFIGWFVGNTKKSDKATWKFVAKEDLALTAMFERPKVDLGLSSGTKWAAYNVGAVKPEEYGGYYAWGETEEKTEYSWATYKWCQGTNDTMSKYCTNNLFGIVDNKTVLDLEDDAAYVKWGGDWRMPTKAEQEELRLVCNWEKETLNGVDGYRITGPNGNSIFLPSASYRYGTDIYDRGSCGDYWSGSLNSGFCSYACHLHFENKNEAWSSYRYYGRSVRAVCK